MNQVIYADCMNLENGLPTLEDKSIDLCLTDPPYNVGFKKLSSIKKEIYKDNIKDYNKWCHEWFYELKRVCNTIIMTPGTPNIEFWYKLENPKDLLFHYKSNGQGMTSVCNTNKTEIIFYYGNKPKKRFKSNTFNIYLFNGFLRKLDFISIHPCPKSLQLFFQIIFEFNPESVLDPFLGSGTTSEVCTKLGIPWLGYEINEVYSQDINKRLKNCKREPKQISIMDCVNR